MSRLLVTGGAGFIGSHLVERLVRENNSVTVLDNFFSGELKNLATVVDDSALTIVEGDIRNSEIVKNSLKDVDRVVHLAAIKSVELSNREPEVTWEVNVKGTKTLLGECMRAQVRTFLFVSSSAVYGEAICVPEDEEHPKNPVSSYGRSKLAGERACLSSGFGDRLRILRPFNVYGPRQEGGTEPNVMTSFMTRLRTGKRPIIYGTGEQTRDFVHVRDLIDCILLSFAKRDMEHNIFNVGSGKAISINSLAAKIAELSGWKNLSPIHAATRRGEIIRSQADIGRASGELGFSPKTELESGLKELIDPAAFQP